MILKDGHTLITNYEIRNRKGGVVLVGDKCESHGQQDTEQHRFISVRGPEKNTLIGKQRAIFTDVPIAAFVGF